MISYVTIGVNDISSARIFYDAVLASLGHVRVYEQPGWLGYTDSVGNYMPRIWVCNPIDGNPATVGNGSMVGLHAKSPAEVDRFHAVALGAGGTDNGGPGERTYHPGYYGAFVLDPDGNNVEAVHHGPASRSAESVIVKPVMP